MRAIAADAHRILNSHHHDKIDSLTRARSTAFAASHVELYMRPHDGEMPPVEDVGRGDVKTPPLWHTAAKMPVGRWYTDGSFHGPFPLMASSMELEKDRPFDALVHVVIPTIKTEFETVVQPPAAAAYPYEIDRDARRARARAVLLERVGCCPLPRRRTTDAATSIGRASTPTSAPIGRASTSCPTGSSRRSTTARWRPKARSMKSDGYAATPLTGVWANYPYLHNGSVPTLYHLLGPVSERPRIFHVMAAGRLDRDACRTAALCRSSRRADCGEPELARRFGDDRDWFNTARPGCGNGGHDVWPRIRTDANRRALIEYLKTL